MSDRHTRDGVASSTYAILGDPWELIDRWLADADRLDTTYPDSPDAARVVATIRRCADDLIELAGPRAFAHG